MPVEDSRVIAPILVVDDRREDLLVLEEVLRGPGYEVLTASSGTEALRRVLERDFAVIVLDVMMPEMDGFELATLIKRRERSRHTPMIFLTAAGSDIRGSYRAYSVGAVDYLAKPLDRDLIRAKVAIFADLFRKDLHIQKQAEALREADRRETELALAELEVKNRHRRRLRIWRRPSRRSCGRPSRTGRLTTVTGAGRITRGFGLDKAKTWRRLAFGVAP